MTFKNFLLAALAVIGCASGIRADVTGTILGNVRDSSSAAVVGAHVVATNIANNFSKESVSTTEGEYRLLALPPGTYKVTVTAHGL